MTALTALVGISVVKMVTGHGESSSAIELRSLEEDGERYRMRTTKDMNSLCCDLMDESETARRGQSE
jgi:hypothetical protein